MIKFFFTFSYFNISPLNYNILYIKSTVFEFILKAKKKYRNGVKQIIIGFIMMIFNKYSFGLYSIKVFQDFGVSYFFLITSE